MQTYFRQELITGRWHVEIHTALEKCNNIVLCVDRTPSLKGALIFRHVSCLLHSPGPGAERYVVERAWQGHILHIILGPEKELGLWIK